MTIKNRLEKLETKQQKAQPQDEIKSPYTDEQWKLSLKCFEDVTGITLEDFLKPVELS